MIRGTTGKYPVFRLKNAERCHFYTKKFPESGLFFINRNPGRVVIVTKDPRCHPFQSTQLPLRQSRNFSPHIQRNHCLPFYSPEYGIIPAYTGKGFRFHRDVRTEVIIPVWIYCVKGAVRIFSDLSGRANRQRPVPAKIFLRFCEKSTCKFFRRLL